MPREDRDEPESEEERSSVLFTPAQLEVLLKRVQLCQKAEVDGTWCRSQLPTLKGGERGVLKAPGLD